MKTFDATITATITMRVDARTKNEAMDFVHFRLPSKKLCPYDGRIIYHLTIDDINLTELFIMDGSTSHDKELVRLINRCYTEKRDAFYEIVRLLSSRDVEEFEDFDTNTASLYDLAYRYLHAIADDEDLRAIIHYCRV